MISALYVDDEPALLELGKIFLERAGGIQVETMSSAPEALIKIPSARYDVIISDYQMPDMDGISFLKLIRSRFPALPFIIFTGKGREDVVIEALNSGADHYIQKGGDAKAQFAELAHTIRRAVERKRANDAILHLNRLYSVLSRTNRAVIHIKNRQELLDEACRIAVEEGKFLMAWIGMVDPATRQVLPVAACGYEEGYLSQLSITVDNVPQGMGLTGSAIREGHPTICNEIQSDPRMEKYRHEAARRGYRSSAGIPIRNGSACIGAMRFYAAEPGFFSDQEIHLLQELVDDISFALELREKDPRS
jgi:CheY-like chemotaxis protein